MANVLMEYTATLANVPKDSLEITVKHVSYQVEYMFLPLYFSSLLVLGGFEIEIS
jgi:hypothetical protein